MPLQSLKNERNQKIVSYIKNTCIKKVWRVCTIGMLMASLAVLFIGVAQALTNSGGGSWQYDRIITIDNNGSALTNYQVLVDLTGSNFPANAQSSGADVRFTDANGTELSYWIENWDAKGGRIWVNVTNIPANGITFMRMYYGNPNATSSSNGTNTFDFFDDFEDYNTGNLIGQLGWTYLLGNSNEWQIQTLQKHSGNKAIGIVTTYDGDRVVKSIPKNNSLELNLWTMLNSTTRNWMVLLRESSNVRVSIRSDNNLISGRFGYYKGPTASDLVDTGITPTLGAWYKWRVVLYSNSTADYYIYNSGGTLLFSATNKGIYTNMVSGVDNIALNAGNPTSPEYFDDFYIRKYTSSEPSVSVGIEQITGPAPQNGFRFVQLTDVHIGPDPIECGFNYNITLNPILNWVITEAQKKICQKSRVESIDRFENVVRNILDNPAKPDFVLITGDLVEWNSAEQYNEFTTLIKKFKENNVDVYIVPGNHDRRGKDFLTWDYYPIPNPFFPNNDLTNYKEYIGDGYNYDIRDNISNRSGYRFIGLDSGYDAASRNTLKYPNGSGLSKGQKDFVNNSILDGKTIIFMHHPIIDDTCADNSCNVISENRDPFIGLAKTKQVKLVLTGHTHKSKFFDSNGKASFNRHGIVNVTIPINDINTFINISIPEPPFLARSPIFIQTRSATKKNGDTLPGYLIVNIESTSVLKEKISLDDVKMTGSNSTPVTSLYLNSPADLHVYDESGRYTGLNATGGIENSIPDSYYFEEYRIGNITLPAFTLLYNTTLNYSYEIVSNFSRENITSDQATFNFTIEQKTQGAITTIKYNNVSINRNSKAYLQINTTQTNYTMQIDLNNDSIIDITKQPDTIETDYAPTATILSPTDGSTWDQGQPVTFNGSGFDREDGTLNKLTWISDRDDVIGHGNFTTANLSAGVHNVILLVNDSVGQVNTSNIVLTVRDTAPPVLDIEYPPENKIFNKQNIAIIGFAYDDSDISKVTVNGIDAGKENWNAIVTLNEGKNIINVTATDNNGFSTISNRTVYYNSSLANDTEPPAVITNLTHKTGLDKSGRAWINWTWDNPEDQDFSYAIVYIDNIPMENTSGSYFSINGLSNDANYNISILSADVVDNINYTEVKETVKTLPPDSTPPVTAIALSGILGSNDWYTSDVQINLAAADNEAGTGVAITEFSFDDINWSTYTAPFNISNEGITAVFYRSTDNAGNVESTRHKSIKIDKTPPEGAISFNASSKDIKVYSNETGGETNYIVLPPKKDNHGDKKSDEDEEKGLELRRYTLKDLAGNLFELVLMHKKEGNEVKVKVISMQYNGGSIIDAPKNEIQVSYSPGKNSSFKELEQKVDVKKQLDAEAKYSFKENKTEIKMKLEGQKEQKLTKTGIVIFELITNKGDLNLTLKDW